MANLSSPTLQFIFQHQVQASGVQLYLPSASLSPWIECFWYGRSASTPNANRELYWYPDGGASLLIPLHESKPQRVLLKRLFQVEKLDSYQLRNIFGIRFKAGAIHHFFKQNFFDSLEISLQQLHKNEYNFPNFPEVNINEFELAEIENWLENLLEQKNSSRTPLDWQTFVVDSSQLSALKTFSTSFRRKLERQFQQFIGTSPANYRLLQQVKSARHALKQKNHIPLSELAIQAGFYDQAHFHRHFLRITGQTPGQYRQRQMSETYNTPI